MSAATGSTLGGVPLSVGTVLAKKFRVERLIGEGGTGIVVGATHLQLEQKVAIKVLRTALASDEIRLRFEREARAIGKIQSEHVVLVLDVGTLEDGSPFMVMEHLEGKDLARVLKESGPLSIEDAVDCMLQVCEALDDAHANGIVHRDLKPANLFLTRRDDGHAHIKVVDFGISKILDSKLTGGNEVTSAFTVLGSPRYMAPEQLRNSKDVDGRADLWSVGAVLFQIITGRHAFDADTNVAASLKVLTTEPAKLRDYAKHAPEELEAIVARCLTKDVNKRWQTAGELADALRSFASDGARDSIERQKEAKEAPSVQIALSVSSTSERPPAVTRSSIPPMPPRRRPPDTVARPPPASGSGRYPAAQVPGVSPVAPVVHTPMTPFQSHCAIPSAKPQPMGRGEMPTSPRAFTPGNPRLPSGAMQARTVKIATPPAPTSNRMKLAIAAGGLIAVLLLFGLLSVGKMVARSLGIADPAVGTSVQTTATATAAPAAAAPTAKTRDPVVVPLDAAP